MNIRNLVLLTAPFAGSFLGIGLAEGAGNDRWDWGVPLLLAGVIFAILPAIYVVRTFAGGGRR